MVPLPSAEGCGPVKRRNLGRGWSNQRGTQEVGGPTSASRERATMWLVFALPSSLPSLVLGSPVRFGFSSIFRKTETETGLPWLEFSKTGTETVKDQSTAVFCGFFAVARPV